MGQLKIRFSEQIDTPGYWQDRPGLVQQPSGVFSSLVHPAPSWQLLVQLAPSWQLLVHLSPSWQLFVHLAHGSMRFLFPAPTWPQIDQPPLPKDMIFGRQAAIQSFWRISFPKRAGELEKRATGLAPDETFPSQPTTPLLHCAGLRVLSKLIQVD